MLDAVLSSKFAGQMKKYLLGWGCLRHEMLCCLSSPNPSWIERFLMREHAIAKLDLADLSGQF